MRSSPQSISEAIEQEVEGEQIALESNGPSSSLGPLWPYALAFAVLTLLALAFAEMSEAARRVNPNSLDIQILSWARVHARQWPVLTAGLVAVTRLGNLGVGDAVIGFVALVLLALCARGARGIRRADPIFYVAVTETGRLFNVALKLWYRRDRPPDVHWLIQETGYSFPSGHAVFAGVTFGLLAILISRRGAAGPAWIKPVGIALCTVFAVLVAVSRVWVGVHYPTDVVGGLLLGLGWAATAWTIRSGWARWRLWRGRTPSGA